MCFIQKKKNKVFSINLGDSRVYFFDKPPRGREAYAEGAEELPQFKDNKPDIVSVTDDHKPMAEAERARIIAAGGQVFFGRISTEQIFAGLAVSRAFGDFQYKKTAEDDTNLHLVSVEPTVVEQDLSKISTICIICDGVHDVLEDPDITRNYDKYEGNADKLTFRALFQGSMDNISSSFIELWRTEKQRDEYEARLEKEKRKLAKPTKRRRKRKNRRRRKKRKKKKGRRQRRRQRRKKNKTMLKQVQKLSTRQKRTQKKQKSQNLYNSL